MEKMRAVRMHAFGAVDVLRYEEITRPVPAAGEVLVRIHAAGINPVDWGARTYPIPSVTGAAGASLPYTLGWDLAGSVVALGPGVTQFSIGEDVYGMPHFPREARAYSEYAAITASDLARKPEKLGYQQAAAVPMAALTAWQALFETAELAAGQTVFIAGGSGGVGHFAIQLAKWKGARVITTTSTRNVSFVRDLGADIVLDYTQPEKDDHITDVDVVLDTMSEEASLRQAIKYIKQGGRVVSLQRAHQQAGTQLAAAAGASFTFILVHPSQQQLAQLATLFDSDQLRVMIEAVYPLQEVARAHQQSEGGHVRGKLVLTIS